MAEENLKLQAKLKEAELVVDRAKTKLIEYEAKILNMKDLLETVEKDQKSNEFKINSYRKENNTTHVVNFPIVGAQ